MMMMIIIVVQLSLRPRPPLRKSSRAFTHTKPRFWGKRKRTRRRLHRSLNSLFFRSSLSVCLFLFLFRGRKCVVVCAEIRSRFVNSSEAWYCLLGAFFYYHFHSRSLTSLCWLKNLLFLTGEAWVRCADPKQKKWINIFYFIPSSSTSAHTTWNTSVPIGTR